MTCSKCGATYSQYPAREGADKLVHCTICGEPFDFTIRRFEERIDKEADYQRDAVPILSFDERLSVIEREVIRLLGEVRIAETKIEKLEKRIKELDD